MDSETLRQKLSQPESAKLDFKIKLHKIFEPKPAEQSEVKQWEASRNQQWAELVKDILALANGNSGTANDIGFLIIGAADNLNSDDSRNLCDVGEPVPTEKQILEKVTSYCRPPSLKIQCQKIVLDEKNLFVVSISPSRHLHILTKALKTPTETYSAQAVLLRRHDGAATYTASVEEQEAIRQEKQLLWASNHPTTNRQADPSSKRRRLSLEVYDRKIAIYRTTRDFLNVIDTHAAIDIDKVWAFGRDTDEALFLFDEEVATYLRELQSQAVNLYTTGKLLASSNLPVGDKRTELTQTEHDLLLWFVDQPQIMRDLFYKYIAL